MAGSSEYTDTRIFEHLWAGGTVKTGLLISFILQKIHQMGQKKFIYVRNEEQIEVISQKGKGDKTPENTVIGH